MKKILLSFLFLSSVAGLYSCSEDFKVAAPSKEITVVYGLLNMQDTAHYIRVQKAFLDENKSALDMAKEPDSNFYNNIEVLMREISGASVSTTVLERVDMNVELNQQKDPGTFFTSPNWGYKYKHPLDHNKSYRLVVNHLNSGLRDSSEITVLDTAALKVQEFKDGYTLKFAITTPPALSVFQIYVNSGLNVKYLEGHIRFRWVEKNLITNVSRDTSADFLFASSPVTAGSSTTGATFLRTANSGFYSFLQQSMKADPNVSRYMDSCDMYVYAGAQDFYNYVLTTQLQASGLTADQIKPIYTNIKGKDVLGLFSSRTFKVRYNVPIDTITMDSLMTNPATKALNIRGRSDH